MAAWLHGYHLYKYILYKTISGPRAHVFRRDFRRMATWLQWLRDDAKWVPTNQDRSKCLL